MKLPFKSFVLTVVLNFRSELNLGIQPAGFTVVKSSRPTEELKKYLTVTISH